MLSPIIRQYKIIPLLMTLLLLTTFSNITNAATFNIEEDNSYIINDFIDDDIFQNDTLRTDSFSQPNWNGYVFFTTTKGYINNEQSSAGFLTIKKSGSFLNFDGAEFISKAKKSNAAFTVATNSVKVDILNGSRITSASRALDVLNTQSSAITLNKQSKISGTTAIHGGDDAFVNLRVNNATVEGTAEAAIRVGGGNIAIEDGAQIIALQGTGIELTNAHNDRSPASVLNISGNNTRIIAKTAIKINGEANVSIQDGAHIEASEVGIEFNSKNINTTHNLNIVNANISGSKKGVVSDSNNFLNLSATNATLQSSAGDAIAMEFGHIRLDNSIVSGKTSGILLKSNTSNIELNNATKISGDVGIQANSNANVTLSSNSHLLGERYGIVSNGSIVRLSAKDNSTISGGSAALVSQGSSVLNLLDGVKLSSNNSGILLDKAAKSSVILSGSGNNVISATDIFKIQSSEESVINLIKQTQFNIKGGGSFLKTENNGDIKLLVNSDKDFSVALRDATGIYVTGQQSGNTLLQFNQLNLSTTGTNASALHINRNSSLQNRLDFQNSSLKTVNATTIRLTQGHFLANISGSVISSLTENGDLGTVFAVDPNSVSSSGQLNFSNSTLLGNIVNHSTLAVVKLYFNQGSLLKGTVENIDELALIDSNTGWQMNLDSNLKSFINQGQFYFREFVNVSNKLTNQLAKKTTNSAKTLTVTENYQANNGWLHYKVNLNPNQLSDKLIINGHATGTSIIALDQIIGLGQKNKEGIELVAINRESNAIFNLDRRYSAAGLEYILIKGNGNNSNPNSWYLRSTTQSHVGAYLGNRLNVINLFSASLKDRLGETVFKHNAANRSSVWLRVTSNSSHSQAADHELNLKDNSKFFLLGGHLKEWSSNGQNRWQLGIMGGYGRGTSAATSHSFQQLITPTKGKIDGYSVGSYLTWYSDANHSKGLYIDNWLQYSWFKNELIETNQPTKRYHSNNWRFSTEIGYAWILGQSAPQQWILEPHGQAIFHAYRAKNFANNLNLTSQFSRLNSHGFSTSLGVRLYAQNASSLATFDPFIELNWLYDPSIQRAINVAHNEFKLDIPKHRYEIKIGINAQLSDNWQSWLNTSLQSGRVGYTYKNLIGSAGIRYQF